MANTSTLLPLLLLYLLLLIEWFSIVAPGSCITRSHSDVFPFCFHDDNGRCPVWHRHKKSENSRLVLLFRESFYDFFERRSILYFLKCTISGCRDVVTPSTKFWKWHFVVWTCCTSDGNLPSSMMTMTCIFMWMLSRRNLRVGPEARENPSVNLLSTLVTK